MMRKKKKERGFIPPLKEERGFTLIELSIVMLIAGLLLAVIIMGTRGAKESANTTACAEDIKTLYTAANLWLNHGYTDYADISVANLKSADLLPSGFTTNNWGGTYTIGPKTSDNTKVEIVAPSVPDNPGASLVRIFSSGSYSAWYDATGDDFKVQF